MKRGEGETVCTNMTNGCPCFQDVHGDILRPSSYMSCSKVRPSWIVDSEKWVFVVFLIVEFQ